MYRYMIYFGLKVLSVSVLWGPKYLICRYLDPLGKDSIDFLVNLRMAIEVPKMFERKLGPAD